MVLNSNDCDDSDRFVNPNAIEICDGIDNDCDLFIDDEDLTKIPIHQMGSQRMSMQIKMVLERQVLSLSSVRFPLARVDIAGDCDDEQAQVYQGSTRGL